MPSDENIEAAIRKKSINALENAGEYLSYALRNYRKLEQRIQRVWTSMLMIAPRESAIAKGKGSDLDAMLMVMLAGLTMQRHFRDILSLGGTITIEYKALGASIILERGLRVHHVDPPELSDTQEGNEKQT